jgi:DNA-binding Lrp family transcriptional regulator
MDSLDIRLLRALFRGQVFTLRGVDPRASVQDLARAAGASRLTVSRRLSRWRTDGFWKGVVAFPNPAFLGSSFQMQGLILEGPRFQNRVEKSIREVLRPAWCFQSVGYYNPILLADSPPETERRQRALRRTGGAQIICPPIDIPFPAPRIQLGPRDWRIVQAMRHSLTLDWPRLATTVGVTVRGLERRVARLMDGEALFFFPEVDFRRSNGTVAWVGLLFGAGVDTVAARAGVTARYPDLLPVEHVFPFESFLPPSVLPKISGGFPFLLATSSAASADQLSREFRAVPGVVEVLIGFPTVNPSYPDAFDSRIELAMHRVPRAG